MAEEFDENDNPTKLDRTCGVCSADLSNLRWHYCVTLGKSFLSSRNACPLCDAPFFPIAASELLSSMQGYNFRVARINELEVESLSLVQTTIENSDEVQFFVIGGDHGAIVVPRYSTRSMIDKGKRKYQQVFDWSSEWSGDIVIERPAIFEFVENCWRIRKHGNLTGSTERQSTHFRPVENEILNLPDVEVSPAAVDRELPAKPNAFEQTLSSESMVPLIRTDRARLKVTARENDSTDAPASETTAPESKTALPNEAAVTFPIFAGDFLEKTLSVGDIVRHDTMRDLLVRGPGSKGELMLVRDDSAPKNGERFFVIPRIIRFRSFETFNSLYKRYYDCAKPAAGEVWIIRAAIVTEVEGGWKLAAKGILEVGNSGKRIAQKQEVEGSSGIEQPAAQTAKISAADVSASRSIQSSFLIALVILGGLVWAVFVAWRFTSLTGKTSPNANHVNLETRPTIVTMALIPGGEFTMGSDIGDEYERPRHKVIVKPFLIDINEVTCEEYEKFIRATGHKSPPGWLNGGCLAGQGRKPVVGVDWYDATSYAAWAKKRLPTEEEWEFAARGTDGRRYPWGNDWRANAANAGDTSAGQFIEVGSYQEGKSPYGVMDMVGNAWEWTASDLHAYPGGQLPDPASGDLRVIRGGFFRSTTPKATTTFRRGWDARDARDGYGNTGFRCAKDL